MTSMRIITLEEHFALPAFRNRVAGSRQTSVSDDPTLPATVRMTAEKIVDLGAGRLADMDRSGISVQVLSKAGNHFGPSADMLDGDEALAFARDFNDDLARKIAGHPDRFAAFAHLPMSVPEGAADELERTVRDLGFRGALISGTIRGDFLDHPRFAPLLQRAEALDVPIYVHPGMPLPEVRKAYYDGFAPKISFGLATFGWGWHYETALHVMRLAVSGALDNYPGLKLIIGHMGEALPFMLARCESNFGSDLSHLRRPLSQTIIDQVYITTAGFFTLPPFMTALTTFGVDRIMFSVDYPYASNEEGRAFLDKLPLSPADLAKVAHGNADRLLKLRPGA
jgi:predicted TIM-barrel fold metal-dependent hydrolase